MMHAYGTLIWEAQVEWLELVELKPACAEY